jgi:putative membrane protein
MHYGSYYGWGYGMGFTMIIFWVLFIVGVVYLVRYIAKGPSRYESRETPLYILKKRYARGEITKEQYDRMREDLKD